MNLVEITERFPTELSCIEYAEKIRFGDTIKCAYCGSTNLSKRNKDLRHLCLNCKVSAKLCFRSCF